MRSALPSPRQTLLAVWLGLMACHAVLYVRAGLAANAPDLYARTWEFQLMCFGLLRLPVGALGLCVVWVLLPSDWGDLNASTSRREP